MPAYRAYPTSATQPKRKARKAARRNIFWENRGMGSAEKKARRIARKKAAE